MNLSVEDLELEEIKLRKRLNHIESHKSHCKKFDIDNIFCGSCAFYFSCNRGVSNDEVYFENIRAI